MFSCFDILVWDRICPHLDTKTLAAVSETCHRLHTLAKKYWLKHIHMRKLRIQDKHISGKTEDEIEAWVKKDGYNLRFVPPEMQTHDIVWKAVANNSWALQFVSPGVMTNSLIVLAIQTSPDMFHSIPADRRTPNFLLKLAKVNGDILKFMDTKLQTAEICWAAVKQQPATIKYVDPKYRTTDLILYAFHNSYMGYDDAYDISFVFPNTDDLLTIK